MQKKNST